MLTIVGRFGIVTSHCSISDSMQPIMDTELWKVCSERFVGVLFSFAQCLLEVCVLFAYLFRSHLPLRKKSPFSTQILKLDRWHHPVWFGHLPAYSELA